MDARSERINAIADACPSIKILQATAKEQGKHFNPSAFRAMILPAIISEIAHDNKNMGEAEMSTFLVSTNRRVYFSITSPFMDEDAARALLKQDLAYIRAELYREPLPDRANENDKGGKATRF